MKTAIASLAIFAVAVSIRAAEITPPINQRFAAGASEIPSLQRHVLPLLGRLGCNGRACHGSFQGQGGFRLSLFGYDFKMDHEALATGEKPRVDIQHPKDSLMLLKPTSSDPDEHGGGRRLDPGSWQYAVISRWIEAGAAPVDEAHSAHFVRLEVVPDEIVFSELGEKKQLRVTSYWSDGTAEDVTPICRFQTNDDAVSKVNESGEITAVGKGDTHVVAFYDNGVVPVATLLPVSDRLGPKYPAVDEPTKIDRLVTTKLRKLGVVPSAPCSDAEFLRRASLDVTGTLPAVDEVRAFLADASVDKRTKKIDELLSRPAYAAWWATRLSDVLGNSENQLRKVKGLGSKSLPSDHWYLWVHRRLSENVAYDKLIEGIVLATGRTSPDQSYEDYCREMTDYGREGAHADFSERSTMPYYWARNNMRKPNEKALSFSYAFLGIRLQCAECHKHPFDQWSQQDFQQFTAFFNRVAYGMADRSASDKMLADLGLDPKAKTQKKELEKMAVALIAEGKVLPVEEVFITKGVRGERGKGLNNAKKQIDATRVITPKVLGGEEVVDANYADPRQPLMDWLRQKDNPYFAKAFVNRVWAQYFNVGIVEPADDMNLANAPSNKDLLDYLAHAFIEHNYDIKWLHREITGSLTYQRSWQPNETNQHDQRNFSHAIPRRLPAEVAYDAVVTATAGRDELAARAANPVELCSIGLARGYSTRNNKGGGGSYALSVFGKPKRETPCDCERSNTPSLLQTVFLRNDQEVATLIERPNGWTKVLAQQAEGKGNRLQKKNRGGNPNQPAADPSGPPAELPDLVSEAYLRAFSRPPDAEELADAQVYVAQSESPAAGLQDLMWALLNSKEFIVNH